MLLDTRTLVATLFLLAATSTPAALATPFQNVGGANFLAITPAAIAVTDTQPATIGLALRANPGAIKPAVFVEGDNVRFSKCRFDYDGSNYDKPQELKMYPKAVFTPGASKGIFATRLAWAGNADHGKTQSVEFDRKVTRGQICQSNGDPHYTTFDDHKFDFMGMECYYLFKSPTLAVQTRHGPYFLNKNAAVNVGAAVIYGKTVWVLDCLTNDVNKRAVMLSPNTNGVVLVENGRNKNDFQFQMSDGAEVKVKMNDAGSRKCWLDVHVVIPAAYRGKTEALCGQYDDNKNNDMTKRGGGKAGNAKEFGDSWKLNPDEDVFVKGYAASIVNEMVVQPDTQECKFPADLSGFGVAPPPVGYTVVPPVAVAKYDPPPLPVVTAAAKGRTDPEFTNFARALCTEAITLPGLAGKQNIPSPQSHIDDCVKDCQLGGTTEPVDGFRIAYQRMVKTILDQAMAKFKLCERTGRPRPRTDAENNAEAERLGLGAFTCPGAAAPAAGGGDYDAPAAPPAQCSGKGTCDTFGCACTKGFTKFDCSLDLSTRAIPPAPKAAAPPAAVAAAPAPPKAPVVADGYDTAPLPAPPVQTQNVGDYRRRR